MRPCPSLLQLVAKPVTHFRTTTHYCSIPVLPILLGGRCRDPKHAHHTLQANGCKVFCVLNLILLLIHRRGTLCCVPCNSHLQRAHHTGTHTVCLYAASPTATHSWPKGVGTHVQVVLGVNCHHPFQCGGLRWLHGPHLADWVVHLLGQGHGDAKDSLGKELAGPLYCCDGVLV